MPPKLTGSFSYGKTFAEVADHQVYGEVADHVVEADVADHLTTWQASVRPVDLAPTVGALAILWNNGSAILWNDASEVNWNA